MQILANITRKIQKIFPFSIQFWAKGKANFKHYIVFLLMGSFLGII